MALLALLMAVSGAPADAGQGWRCDRSPLVVTNARLWNDGKPQSHSEILIVDGRIRAVGRSGRLSRVPGARVLDARGGWLLPGLIDSHAHFGRAALLTAGLLPQGAPPSWTVTGPQTLASGVTTVRIHYSDLQRGPRWAQDAADDCHPSPRVLLGAGGLLGGKPEPGAWLPQVASPDEARQRVQENRAVGATWIALHDTDKFSPDVLGAIIDEAHKSSMRVMASGDSVAEAMAGVTAGVDAVDQLDGSASSTVPEALTNALESHKAYLVAPMGFYARYNAYRSDPSRIDQDAWAALRLDDPAVGAALVRGTRERFQHPPDSEQQLVDGFAARKAKFRQLLQRPNLALVVGSDAGSQGHFHGDAIWWELRTWRDNGASVPQLLSAATSVPAKMIGMPDRGTIASGAIGDFLIYNGDLEKGELELSKVTTVAKGGVIFVDRGRWVGPKTYEAQSKAEVAPRA